MIPSGWQFALLTLAVYRLWRLAAIDDMPWLVTARSRIVGAHHLDGSETWAFDRPTLAHAIHCPWCSGLWVAFSATGCWWLSPHWTVVAAVPFAVSTAAGALGHFLNE